ncbi:MAG: hypothetical protein M3042_12580 [Actinomycetota bacterium]|nr:hypothetical protein [Actinomycetota bacterium]
MTLLLVIATVLEVVVVVAVLVFHLVLLDRRLRQLSKKLGTVAFGIRAVESQTAPIGPSVLRLNAVLGQIAGALGPLLNKAERAAGA